MANPKKGYCSKWKDTRKLEQLCDYYEPKRKRLKTRCRNCKFFCKDEFECLSKDEYIDKKV